MPLRALPAVMQRSLQLMLGFPAWSLARCANERP